MADETTEWWRSRLTDKLRDQRLYVEEMEAWYEGHHPLPAADATNSDLYRRFQKMSQTNLVQQVVNAVASRMSVEGIRMGDPTADEDAWSMWQASSMDAQQTMLITVALYAGLGYLSVWPDEDNPTGIRMAPEHPAEIVHEMVPGMLDRRAAALKIYEDNIAGDWVATLYLPTHVTEWRSAGGSWGAWAMWTETNSFENPFAEVPVIPLLNKPTLRGGWSSEMHDGIPIQRRINQTLLNMMVAQEAVAFPQRWATGLEIEKDAEGNPKRPFKSGPDSLWVSEDETAKFGQFGESRFDGYLGILQNDVESMSATTSTPTFALSAKLSVPPSAEALTAMESSLVKKVEDRQRVFGEALEEAFRLGFRMLDDPRADAMDAEVIWKDPRIRSDAQTADWVTKAATVGVPQEALWEKLGASPQEIARWKGMSMSEVFRQLVAQVGQQGQAQQTPEQTATVA
jgi:hypothetical protein